ncbi:molybdenum cofactor guanylyltransferase [Halopiger goleimassiliensis]|uniref:molybdenum cofactor guanylyltransferase n=1 Tax=Halopiger goleimassiliensis TaxID=1293048 RepID=UPI00067792A3|nr:molybdenum cofactor guanylyltransferase [Halopiger goleimassiliensis]
MTSDRSLAGLVVAGGFSTRFGDRDKALARIGDEPLVRRVVGRLARVTAPVVVNCRPAQVDPFRDALAGHADVRFSVDRVPDRGPVAGVHAGLAAIDREYAAVVPCDMPFVDPDLLEVLAERARGHDGALVRLTDGYRQPFQAVYRTDAMRAACEQVLESDDERVFDAVDRLETVTVSEQDLDCVGPATFESVETRTELEDVRRRLEQDGDRSEG